MALVRTRRCLKCGTQYSVIEHRGTLLALDTDANDPVCSNQECKSEEWESIVGVPLGVELGDVGSVGKFYPRFDRGLGCTVNSAAHRRQIMDARGLEAVDGDFDEQAAFAESAENKHHREVWNKYTSDLEHSPEFAEARELRDKGHPDFQWQYTGPEE